MVAGYPFIPIFIIVIAYMCGLFWVDSAPETGRLQPIPEDRALAMLKDDYANDRLSLEEFDAAVGKALQGQSYQQASVEANMKTMGQLMTRGTTYIGNECYVCKGADARGFCSACSSNYKYETERRKMVEAFDE